MRLNELPVGSSVNIKVFINGEELEFESRLIARIDKPIGVYQGACIEVIKVDGKVITFNSAHTIATITSIEDNRMYKFHLAGITRQNIAGLDTMLILSTDDTKPINHREAVRVPLCEDCILKAGQNRESIDAVTRDVSCTGISFSFPHGNFKYSIGEEVSAQFYVGAKGPYNVTATIVRDMQEENRTIIGCSFSRIYPVINQLVNKLQVRNKT